ncbi:MAG: sigma-54-dependent Fis family transcriptional regulator [Candidatus Rokubacteria bacterium]|nr:sigma-54-dependent Fis family transcriptional regulator [Candidatus Rokubacteria bacterium]
MARILVVDDEPDMRWLLAGVLQAEGLEVVTAEDGQAALDRVMADAPATVILDLRMPGLDGMSALGKLKTIAPQVPVIMLTAYGDIPTAVQAMRLGAYDYLTKPFHNDDIVLTVRRALERQALLAEVEELRSQLGEGGGSLSEHMGPSQEIQKVIRHITQVASSTFTVLIQGETGTGKELVARAIHQQSARCEKPFIALDCGAIPETLIESELFGYEKGAFTGADRRKEGHFQLAEGGSLFLDEITNLPLTTQAKLLRVLQEREVQLLGGKRAVPVNVRIIAASNVPLETEMRAGRFRHDLYYRLNEFTIALPPLRERQEDILYLAKRFLEEASMELKRPVRGISEEAAPLLLRHPWPGNARELRNVIRQAVLLSPDLIRPEHLAALGPGGARAPLAEEPRSGSAGLSLREASEKAAAEAERQAIRHALQATQGNKSEAARLLRTDYKTLHVKMKRYGIRTREFQGS